MDIEFYGVWVAWYKFGANKEYTSRREIKGDEPG